MFSTTPIKKPIDTALADGHDSTNALGTAGHVLAEEELREPLLY